MQHRRPSRTAQTAAWFLVFVAMAALICVTWAVSSVWLNHQYGYLVETIGPWPTSDPQATRTLAFATSALLAIVIATLAVVPIFRATVVTWWPVPVGAACLGLLVGIEEAMSQISSDHSMLGGFMFLGLLPFALVLTGIVAGLCGVIYMERQRNF